MNGCREPLSGFIFAGCSVKEKWEPLPVQRATFSPRRLLRPSSYFSASPKQKEESTSSPRSRIPARCKPFDDLLNPPTFSLKISPNTQEVSSGASRRRLRGSQTVFFCLTELLLWTTSLTLLDRRASDSLTRRFPSLTLFGLEGWRRCVATGPQMVLLIFS